jgi:type IV pilus assembly protein PilQ
MHVGRNVVFSKSIVWVALALGQLCGILAVNAATLQDVGYTMLPGDRINITLTLDSAAQVPGSFATSNPARIAIDLPGTTSALAKKTKTIGTGIARSITAIEAGDKTRVVINLLKTASYDISAEGNKIIVSIDSGGSGSGSGSVASDFSTVTESMTPSASTTSGSASAISDVGFRRGSQGEGRIEVQLSSANSAVDMRQEGKKVVVDFIATSLPAHLSRTMDVTDFATPVQSIVTHPQGGSVRMEIATTGEYEHFAYQAEGVYTIEFRSLTKAEKAAIKKERNVFSGERLSLNFQDIKIRSLLQILADFTGLNMVVSDTVGGRITLRLKNVPWDHAMDIILKTKGLSMRKTDNVILVAPTEEIAAREKLELESQKQIEELAPLQSELIQINYADAEEMAVLLKSEENRILTVRGNVTVDVRTNTLLVQDTASKIEEIRELLEKLDIPGRQVLVEARIVIANDDFAHDIGVRFGFNRGNSFRSDNFLITGGGVPGHLGGTFGLAPGIENPADSSQEALLVNLPQTLASGRGGAINFVMGKIGSYLLQLELSAMQQEGRGEIISSPRVITSDQSTASIKQGVEIPYQSAASSGATAVSFKEAVLELEVTPHITPDDRIIMDLLVSKNSADFSRSVLGTPPLDTREIETNVLVDNGETIVLGGIFERNKTYVSERVPFFGDLPYVGNLFKQQQNQDNNSELLIFVTPKILKETLTLR